MYSDMSDKNSNLNTEKYSFFFFFFFKLRSVYYIFSVIILSVVHTNI